MMVMAIKIMDMAIKLWIPGHQLYIYTIVFYKPQLFYK